VCYWNVWGLCTELNDLTCNIPLFNYDYFVSVETWLSVDIFDAELGFDCYKVFCLDRSEMTSKSTRGGVVAIFVNKRSKAEIKNLQHDSFCIDQVEEKR